MSWSDEFTVAGTVPPPTFVYPVEQRAADLRAYYGKTGKIVYDHKDRWDDEHVTCRKQHAGGVEACMYVIHCPVTNSVAVCESWQFERP